MGVYKRNGLCWCGSGAKYKKCHLDREGQKKQPLWDVQARFRKIHKTKLCLYPIANDATCSGGIVRAHTVRRSADLKTIARGGHVYQGQIDFATLNKTGGRITARLVGVNEASTFWGFCQGHDSFTFAPLETQAFGPSAEQAFLLAYRPLVKELYLKMRQLEANELCREADKGKSLVDQWEIQEIVSDFGVRIKSAIYDLNHHKALFDNDLIARDFSRIRYVAIHFDRTPDIMCSGAIQPVYSFDGRAIQNLSAIDSVLQQATFSLLATEAGGAAVFAWHAESDAASSVLADSLLALPRADIPAALVRFALSELENSFLRPVWWETLNSAVQRSLEDRINHNVNPFIGINRNCLGDDGVRAVDWQVTRIDQKRN